MFIQSYGTVMEQVTSEMSSIASNEIMDYKKERKIRSEYIYLKEKETRIIGKKMINHRT